MSDILDDPEASLELFGRDGVLARSVIYALSFSPRSQQWNAHPDRRAVGALERLFQREIRQDPTITAAGEYLAAESARATRPAGPMPKTFFGMPLDDGPMGF